MAGKPNGKPNGGMNGAGKAEPFMLPALAGIKGEEIVREESGIAMGWLRGINDFPSMVALSEAEIVASHVLKATSEIAKHIAKDVRRNRAVPTPPALIRRAEQLTDQLFGMVFVPVEELPEGESPLGPLEKQILVERFFERLGPTLRGRLTEQELTPALVADRSPTPPTSPSTSPPSTEVPPTTG